MCRQCRSKRARTGEREEQKRKKRRSQRSRDRREQPRFGWLIVRGSAQHSTEQYYSSSMEGQASDL